MKYRVIDQRVEINGKDYNVGDELKASDFRPASGNIVTFDDGTTGPELSELDSLLATGHIEEV